MTKMISFLCEDFKAIKCDPVELSPCVSIQSKKKTLGGKAKSK